MVVAEANNFVAWRSYAGIDGQNQESYGLGRLLRGLLQLTFP